MQSLIAHCDFCGREVDVRTNKNTFEPVLSKIDMTRITGYDLGIDDWVEGHFEACFYCAGGIFEILMNLRENKLSQKKKSVMYIKNKN